MQQTHGSLRSQCDASVCHFELCCVLGGGRGSHSRCSRAAGSLRLHGSPPSDASNRASNLLAYSVSDGALHSGEAEPRLPSVAVCEPPVCRWSYAAYSATDEALPPGAAELQAPFSHSGSPPYDTSNRASFSAARGTLPSGAAEPQLCSDAARVPHLISAIVLLF